MSSFAPLSLRDLYLSPRAFFLHRIGAATRLDLRMAAYLIGISAAQGRLDKQLIKYDLAPATANRFLVSLADSWLATWGLILVAGTLSALVTWYLGAWWYRVRLRWAGAQMPDAELARGIYLHAGVVYALPGLVLLVVQTLLWPSYLAAWQAEEMWSSLLLVFPFWSVWASYSGVRARFELGRWGGRLWFLILPIVVYCLVFGLLGLAYSLLDTPSPAEAAA